MSSLIKNNMERVGIKFCNEITLSVDNGFENNVKYLSDVLVEFLKEEIIIHPTIKGVEKAIHVPKTNIANYWRVEGE